MVGQWLKLWATDSNLSLVKLPQLGSGAMPLNRMIQRICEYIYLRNVVYNIKTDAEVDMSFFIN